MQEEKIIQTKNCRHCNKSFDITDRDIEFYDKISPKINWQKFQIPTPTLCPDCRQQRRLSFRNERKLYRRKCDATGKDIISIYSPDKPYKVYDQKVRRSDDRDPMTYARDFDFSKSFTEQFGDLMKEVPRMSLVNDDWTISQNCSYTNDFWYWKDCYMCFEMWDAEWCFYCNKCWFWKDLIDCSQVTWSSKSCYQSTDSDNIYNCFYVKTCSNSNNCYFSENLTWCENCFLSIWLVNQKFIFLNAIYSELEYNKFTDRFFNDINYKNESILKYNNLVKNNIYINQKSSESSIWNWIINSKNVIWNYIINSNDLKYCTNCDEVSNSYDTQWWKCSFCYESMIPDLSYNNLFTIYCRESSYINYSDLCFSCQNCFGCIWLRNKQYCIFNKQYTESEYFGLVAKIITHMQSNGERWEFFHPSLSPFAYNETVAMEYYSVISEDCNKISEDKIYENQNLPISSEILLIQMV